MGGSFVLVLYHFGIIMVNIIPSQRGPDTTTLLWPVNEFKRSSLLFSRVFFFCSRGFGRPDHVVLLTMPQVSIPKHEQRDSVSGRDWPRCLIEGQTTSHVQL